MANEIKLKRGSGSDPGTSDLSVGEIAIRTDNGKLFTKRDNGSVTEITGGGGIDDGDKGDITVSNSGATFTIDDNAVTTAKINGSAVTNTKLAGNISADKLEVNNAHIIVGDSNNDGSLQAISGDATLANNGALTIANGAINNAKVASGAAIAGTKISPDFGSQAITTTGNCSFGDLTLENAQPSLILSDNNAESDFALQNRGGVFTVRDIDNNANRFQVATDGTTTVAGNLDVGNGLDLTGALSVTGNIGVSGTVDGRDVASDGSKLDGIESGATADQTNSEIKTAYEANSNTNAFTDALLSKLNGIAASATNVTNNNQLTNGAGYITATLTNEQVQDIVGGMVTGNTESGITVTYQDSDGTLDFVIGTLNQDTTGNAASADTIDVTGSGTDSSFGLTFVASTGSAKTLLADTSGLVFNPYSNTLTTNNFNGGGASLTDLNASNITSGTLAAARVATLNQSTTGNAATATKLATARNIAGVSFDGSANISLNNNAITNGAGYITDLVSDTSPQLGGDLDTNSHNILLDDNHFLYLGDTQDASITNTGSYLFIKNHSGAVAIQATNEINLQKYENSDIGLKYTVDGSIALYHDNSKKVETSSSGVTVTGTCTATAFAGDGSSLTGISAGATGGGSDEVFYENDQTVTTNYTITNGKNAMAAGPITINSGVTVTVGSGETLTIV